MDWSKELASAGAAVIVLLVVLKALWTQHCTLQTESSKAAIAQASALAASAASNEHVATAVTGLREFLQRGAEGDANYQAGMKEFAKTMTTIATNVDKKQDETLLQIAAHRTATERQERGGKHTARPA